MSHYSKKIEFHLANPGSHSILYLKEESKFSEFLDFVYYSEISWQIGSDPFISEKKNCSDYRVHGIQINQLGLTISTQQLVLKKVHRVLRYHQKSVQNWTSKPNQQILTYFGRYLRTRCIFFKTDCCVEIVSPSRLI